MVPFSFTTFIFRTRSLISRIFTGLSRGKRVRVVVVVILASSQWAWVENNWSMFIEVDRKLTELSRISCMTSIWGPRVTVGSDTTLDGLLSVVGLECGINFRCCKMAGAGSTDFLFSFLFSLWGSKDVVEEALAFWWELSRGGVGRSAEPSRKCESVGLAL